MFNKYDVLVAPFRIIQMYAMSEADARNLAMIKGYIVMDVALSLE